MNLAGAGLLLQLHKSNHALLVQHAAVRRIARLICAISPMTPFPWGASSGVTTPRCCSVSHPHHINITQLQHKSMR